MKQEKRKITALRAARKAKGLTLQELARKSSLSYTHLRRIDAGVLYAKQARTMFLISRALDDRQFRLWPEDARADLRRLASLR